MKTYDYIVIGSGVIGLTIARELQARDEKCRILLLDKESKEAMHASGRNSGVLHAGFYYPANSLKAKFTVEGNRLWKEFCRERNLPLNDCGKLVVANDEHELGQLQELLKRGQANGSNVELIEEERAREIEPNIKTYKQALYSPDTASVDPRAICHRLKQELLFNEVEIVFDCCYKSRRGQVIETTKGEYEGRVIINAAGLYADHVAKDFGFGEKYTMIPFKGLYLKYTKNTTDVKINVYPVPNLKYPFLGVHYTKTVHDEIKIGPTAMPAFWRENYTMKEGYKFSELREILWQESKLFLSNSFGFRDLAFEEMKKYRKDYFVGLAQKMIPNIDPKGFTEFTKPGIRAQLLDKEEKKLVQDFVIEGDAKSVHVLNAVSPAFTCAIPFARYVVSEYL